MDTGTVILTLVGTGIIVVGILNLMRLPSQSSVVIVEEGRRYPERRSGWGPYYSHLPARHLVY